MYGFNVYRNTLVNHAVAEITRGGVELMHHTVVVRRLSERSIFLRFPGKPSPIPNEHEGVVWLCVLPLRFHPGVNER